MGTAQDKSHPLTKLLTTTSKKWPWARKMWKVLAQRTSLNSIFFQPLHIHFFLQEKNRILPRWHQFCETEGFLGRYYKSWAVNKNANFEIFSARVSVKNSWLYCLKSPQNILWDNAHKSITTYMYLHVKFYEGLGINKDLLQREALLTDTLVSRDL